jgi:uncharacterized protein YecT (DUF1311 family)
MKIRAIALIGLLCAAGFANPALAGADERAIKQCLAKSGANPETCIGIMSNRCVDRMGDNYTTVGMKGCLHAELQFWDNRLNASYKRLRKMNGVHSPNELRDMQRAWIKFRDSKCGYETGLWGDGTGGGVVWAGCTRDETGRQALFLENLENY